MLGATKVARVATRAKFNYLIQNNGAPERVRVVQIHIYKRGGARRICILRAHFYVKDSKIN